MIKGTLRIVFTGEDLARVRIAGRADVMWEMALSLHILQRPGGASTLSGWRRQARADLAEAGLLKPVRERLVPLVPIKAYFPDFLTPYESMNGFRQGLDVLADTPSARVRHEVDQLRPHVPVPATLDDLARGNRRSIRGLARLSERYCQVAFGSRRTDMEAALGRERARLTRVLTDQGVEAMLASLGPSMRWRPPVLEADYATGRYEIHLQGRGLTLIPSYFGRFAPVAMADVSLPPVLVFPIQHATPAPGADPDDALPDLLGATRARVLRCIAATDGCTTSELARRTGASLSSASAHAQVLQRAGLVTSTRHANMVIHQITRLGNDLILRRQ
ncbi:transcriptional regulator [Nonomuraea sp. WAC 01424]|uniref:helix-turn-helix domain-containing protein n=1 Tax=Nonomuraea sp. WAC 01424 TaxID=2203200 RepID=UPI000F7AC218|nr:helix-turn-helix domain-containing protein [Nonomuraea sp. WAC 01424]RSM95323.1 transcriptional regulator [Nonomuraea sp. WAC 01424]